MVSFHFGLPSAELLARVKALLRRANSSPGNDDVLRFGRLEIDLAARQARIAGNARVIPCVRLSHAVQERLPLELGGPQRSAGAGELGDRKSVV